MDEFALCECGCDHERMELLKERVELLETMFSYVIQGSVQPLTDELGNPEIANGNGVYAYGVANVDSQEVLRGEH